MPATSGSRHQASNTSSPAHPQSQSPLFSLPAELRERIFSLALDCPFIPLTVIDLITGGRKVTLVTPGVGGPAVDTIQAQQVLSLPLTCRRGRQEALPLLYSSNTIDVYDPAVFPIFAHGRSAQWVRRLDFSWTCAQAPPPASESKKKRFGGLLGSSKDKKKSDQWEEVWRDVASFKDLQWIRLEISVPYTWTPEWSKREQELLTPLKAIPLKSGAEAELTVSWEKAGSAGANAEDFLQGWSVKRRLWGAGADSSLPDS